MQVFLCHSSSDKERVRELYHQLLAEKFDPWLDVEKLRGGQDWELEIRRAVRSSGVVIVCLSRDSITKEGYVQREIRLALDVAQEKPPGTIFVIPLKLEECDVPDGLRQWQWIDYFREDGFERLRSSLIARRAELDRRPVSTQPPSSAPASSSASDAPLRQQPPPESQTRTDELFRRAKNNRLLAWVIVGGSVITVVLGLIVQADSVRKVFWPTLDKPSISSSSSPSVAPPSSPMVQPAPEKQQPPKETALPSDTASRRAATPPKPTQPGSTPATTQGDRLFAHCQSVVMRTVIPPEGHIYVLAAREQRGGRPSLMDFSGPPGSEWKQTDSNGSPAWGYRCELTNYSKDVLFNLTIPVGLTFRTPLPVPGNEKARKEGDITLERDWEVSVPRLDPSPAAPFIFYIWNSGVQKFIQVRLPAQILVEGGKKVSLIQSRDNLLNPLNPDPFN